MVSFAVGVSMTVAAPSWSDVCFGPQNDEWQRRVVPLSLVCEAGKATRELGFMRFKTLEVVRSSDGLSMSDATGNRLEAGELILKMVLTDPEEANTLEFEELRRFVSAIKPVLREKICSWGKNDQMKTAYRLGILFDHIPQYRRMDRNVASVQIASCRETQ